MVAISVIIITHNEAANIGRCLHSIKGIADEVIVVDSFSIDETVSIAKASGAIVIQHAFEGYGAQKYFAQQQASNDWILSMDADEALSDTLQQSILTIKANPRYNAYKFNFLTNYCGNWIRHCGWYPDPKLRLWDKTKGTMLTDKVHEGFVLNSRNEQVGFLNGDMLHYSFNTISDHLKKIQHYSQIGAEFDVARGKKCSLIKLLLAPKWEFLNSFIFHLGFLDGYYGYVVCKNSAFASFAKYIKIRQFYELNNKPIN